MSAASRLAWVVVWLTVWIAGAASAQTPEAPLADPKEAVEAQVKRRGLERDLELARRRIEVAELRLQAEEASAADDVALAEREVALARAERTHFEKDERPRRIAEMELDVKRMTDAAGEADEELKQIELMSREQDLEDMTAEFVIARGRRNAERQQRELKLRERAMEGLLNALENESVRHALALERKQADLAKATRAARLAVLEKRIELEESRAKVQGILDELGDRAGEDLP